MPLIASSPAFKEILREICPNEFNFPINGWLKIVSKRIGIDHERVSRLWRDNRAKFYPEEVASIEEALDEVRHNKFLRELTRQRQRNQYLQHIISGEMDEDQKENITQAGQSGAQDERSFA